MKTGVEAVQIQAPPQRARAAPKMDKAPVKMEGYLEKKGKLRVVSLWKRYWFVLEGRLLLYYKSQQEYLRLSPCRGSLNMGLASCVRPGPDRDDGHVLEVVLRAHVVTLRAKDRASQEQWLKALLDSMVLPSVLSPTKDSRTPLHFRYPSADNLSKPDQANGKELVDTNAPRKEKHRTLPNWKRMPSSAENRPLASVAEKILALGRHSEVSPKRSLEDVSVGQCVTDDRSAHAGHSEQRLGQQEGSEKLHRGSNRGSILSHLARDGSPNKSRAIHPIENPDFTSPFGNQRYSFHCLRKGEEGESDSPQTEPKNLKNKLLNKSMENIDEDRPKRDRTTLNIEELVKKQLSYTSLASQTRKHSATPKGAKHSHSTEDMERGNYEQYSAVSTSACTACQNLVMSDGEEDHCHCKHIKSSSHGEEKENIEKKKRKPQRHSSIAAQYRPDENQNQRFIDDFCIDQRIKMKAMNLDKSHSGSERGMLAMSGIDLSMNVEDIPEHFKSVRCTSADTLWSPSRKASSECCESISHAKHSDIEVDVEYFDAADVHRLVKNSSDSKSNQEKGSGKEKKRTHISLRQHLLHGDGEYVKYSDPEDSDKRDSTLNTTNESCQDDLKTKPKLRMKKRKTMGRDSCDSNSSNVDSSLKKRASVRNRLSFLSRVLSHVRRSRDGAMDNVNDPVENDLDLVDAQLPSPDMTGPPKTSSTLQRDVEHPPRKDSGLEQSTPTNFEHSLPDAFPGEAPEEPPPDYDSVTLDSTLEAPQSPTHEQPPQLPPRRMKRPRSPWHDVPTNNSPVVDMDNEARCRLLSAAKHGRVIGTRGPHNIETYDWSDMQDDAVHHAYEVVSDDDTSPAGSNEHLAIYLSSESSDDEFHEEVVLRRSFQDSEFLSGFESRPKQILIGNGYNVLQPLTINTQDLPTLDSSGRVGLSHVEAMKLSLLMQAQKTSHDSAKLRRQEELEKLKTSQSAENSGKVETTLDVIETCEEYSNGCVQEPPKEFADKEKSSSSGDEDLKKSPSQDTIPEVQNLLAPVEELLQKFMEKTKEAEVSSVQPVNGSDPSETIVNGHTAGDICTSTFDTVKPNENPSQDTLDDKPPELPAKTKKHEKVNCVDEDKRHSDELNVLLAQLASMTTAPLLPAGATSSLQFSGACIYDDFDGTGMVRAVTSRKQSLSLSAVGNTCDDSEPDYDIPRPHASLIHMLSKNIGFGYHNSGRDADDIVVEATHFFSRPESPRTPESPRIYGTGDQSWTGNISPDSLDLPTVPKRPLIWDAYDLMQSEHTPDRVPRKQRVKKDRNRRATLSGPIVDIPSVQTRLKPQSGDQNSAQLSVNEMADIWQRREMSSVISERRNVDPKQLEHLASTCEHSVNPVQSSLQSHRVKNFTCVSDLCKKFEHSSLEDISERSELERSESCNVKREAERIQNRIDMLKLDEVDYDSLEVHELKTNRLDLSEKKGSVPLLSIVEESDVISDKSGKSDDEITTAKNGPGGTSSGSASEGALMCEGDSESRATDQQATHATDTDMELLSDDDDVGELSDCVADKSVGTSRVIEPDSLLHESLAPMRSTDELDGTKDASFEADSLEPKK